MNESQSEHGLWRPPESTDMSIHATLRARRNLAAWISEHGREDKATCELIEVLADLDQALDTAGCARAKLPAGTR